MSFLSKPFSYLSSFFFTSSTSSSPSSVPPPAPSPTPFPPIPSSTLTLPSGRRIGFAQAGSSSGTPVFYCAGLPGSRLEIAGFDAPAREFGIRLIAIDRPGIGLSDWVEGRTLAEWPRDVEDLARELGVGGRKWGVLGISGGGPYALSCARYLPSASLSTVVIICGMGPPSLGMSGADLVHRMGFPYGLRYSPFFLTKQFWASQPAGKLHLSPEKRLELFLQAPVANEKDKAYLTSAWPPLSIATQAAAFAGCTAIPPFQGVWWDGKIICTPFGFALSEIRKDLKIRLWWGKEDVHVPIVHGRGIRDGVLSEGEKEGERVRLWETDDTHASIVVTRIRDVFRDLRMCLDLDESEQGEGNNE